MKAQAFLIAMSMAGAAAGRVVLLQTDNPGARSAVALSAEAARSLDEATNLALFERPDTDPCKVTSKREPKLLVRAPSEAPRTVSAAANLSDLVGQARAGEEVTIYAVSWDRRLELRGISTTPVPTRATLPRWIEKDFSRAAKDMVEKSRGKGAAVLFADLAERVLDRKRWEGLGVWFPKESPASAVPFLTRVDFSRPKQGAALTFASKNTLPQVRPELVVRVPFTGPVKCPEAEAWIRGEPERVRSESVVLHELTGWSLQYVLARVGIHPSQVEQTPP